MSAKSKEHIKSALITFISAFALTIASYIGDTTVSLNALEVSALVGILSAALRAGVKEVVELSTTWIQ